MPQLRPWVYRGSVRRACSSNLTTDARYVIGRMSLSNKLCLLMYGLVSFANWFVLSPVPVPVPPLKRSPRTQGSTICRSRRPGVVTQPPAGMISQDPDLLIPIRAPYPCFDEEDRFLKTLKKQYVSLPTTFQTNLFSHTAHVKPLFQQHLC